MAEYIEREKVLSKAAHIDGCFSDMISAYDVAGIPAADVAPVVHGRWEWREKWDVDIPNHNSTLEYCGWYCSHCGIELGEYMTKNTNEKHYYDDDFCKPTLNRCPNCGARMDLEENT